MQSNPSASIFWKQAISKFTAKPVPPVPMEKDGKSWQLYSFDSKPV